MELNEHEQVRREPAYSVTCFSRLAGQDAIQQIERLTRLLPSAMDNRQRRTDFVAHGQLILRTSRRGDFPDRRVRNADARALRDMEWDEEEET